MEYFIKTERLGFSNWSENDLSLAVSLWGEAEVTKYICANGTFTHEEIKHRLHTEISNFEKYGVQYFPFFSLESGDLIGCCGLRPYQEKTDVYELGFHLKTEYWKQGFAFEAATAMIAHAFSTLQAKELKAGHNPQNIASKNLLHKLGFHYETDEYYAPTGLFHPLYSMKSN